MRKNELVADVGNRLLDALTQHAREDIAASPAEMADTHFSFIQDESLKQRLAETLYGAKWVYSIGKLLATENQELQAHVRTQLINFGAICEAVFEYAILDAAKMKVLVGEQWKYSDLNKKNKIRWGSPPANLPRGTNFAWMVAVAFEESMIDADLEKRVTKLRELRNTIHLTHRDWSGDTNQPKQSKESHDTLEAVLKRVAQWLDNSRKAISYDASNMPSQGS
ncbi:hypothetical protein [Aeromonas bestiarum]|uniref:hypothetical protein n=1 Tax=Aeromonas bestiarum TaxID=105751 RepID=UPI003D201BEC